MSVVIILRLSVSFPQLILGLDVRHFHREFRREFGAQFVELVLIRLVLALRWIPGQRVAQRRF